MTPFLCPVCKSPLQKTEHTYRCVNGHSFDVAKSGYVNLLPSGGSGHHGDDKLMVRARRDFLNAGYYDPLSAALCEEVLRFLPSHSVLLDAGCGEGKYTVDLLHALDNNGKSVEVIGIDISKDALIYAAKRSSSLHLAAASSAALPLRDASIDCILNVFSPLILGEFSRVLKSPGILVRVIPLEDHLWDLKALVYEKPYPNDVPSPELEGFHLLSSRDLRYRITLDSSKAILSLFQMTPYYYKTGKKDQQKVEMAETLDTVIAFRILIYQK